MNGGPNKPRGPRPPHRDGHPKGDGASGRREGFSKPGNRTDHREGFAKPSAGPDQRGSFAKPNAGPDQRGSFAKPNAGPDQRRSFAKPGAGPDQRGSFAKPNAGPDQRGSFSKPNAGPDQRRSFAKPGAGPDQRRSFAKPGAGPDQRRSFAKPGAGPDQRRSFAKPGAGPDQRRSFAKPAAGPDQRRSFTKPTDLEKNGTLQKPSDNPAQSERPAGPVSPRPNRPAPGFRPARPATGAPGFRSRTGPGGSRFHHDHSKTGPSAPKAAPAEKKPAGPDARRIALNALLAVTASGAYSTLALDEHLRASRIDPIDKRLATSIFYTALENRLKLAYALKQFVDHMPDREIGCILHIAAAQLLMMDKIPDYAAVDAAVEQARAMNREAYAALVNGALRTLVRARDAGEIHWPERDDPMEYLSVMYSLPVPLASRLVRDYGLEEAERIIAYRPEVRTETVRPNLTKMDGPAFAAYGPQHGWNMEKATAPNAWHLLRPGDLTNDPDYKMGLFSVQGEGSMLAAYALEAKSAGNYLDACAAPGGKSALIAELMQQTGRVQSWDVHEHRVELIQTTKKRLRLDNLRPAHRDASIPREELNGTFDGVLIDAPCSGLGVMHDKPDIKYRVTEADLDTLVALQQKILDACAPYVAPGGLLVYATCTILKDENECQVRSFLQRHPEFEPEPDRAYLPDALKPLCLDGMVQLQAYAWNAEGFFIARMRRVRP